MFEKEAEEWVENNLHNTEEDYIKAYKDGAEFGYNKAKEDADKMKNQFLELCNLKNMRIAELEKANEDVKHDLMMKLKDEGIVKVLKDSIFCNKKLSSQEQQELCSWIECAIDFGENLDECAKELEEANKANEWHYVKDGDFPKEDDVYLVYTTRGVLLGHYEQGGAEGETDFQGEYYSDFTEYPGEMLFTEDEIIAWKEIVLPELKESK